MAENSEKPENENSTNNKANEEEEVVDKKRKYKEIAPYGNYRSYYGYRIGNNIEEDPRFKVLRKEWFEGKDCLDIGCNSGLITMNIAKKFECRSILGIDIDHARIKDAWGHLKKFARRGKAHNGSAMAFKRKVLEVANESGCAEACSTSPSSEPNLFDIVYFKCENFVSNCSLLLEDYDTIICLSVTKWVHLNWGDQGIIRLFAKIWRLLRPGGFLVLEPQPWESYYKNRLTTETTNKMYHSINHKPEDFQEILLDKIGFKTVEQAASSVSGAALGFDRPVLVFRK